MADFLRQHQEQLINRVSYWHGDVPRASVERIMRNFRFVAETYMLTVPASATRRATIDMAMLLALWAAASRGIDSLYGSDENECRQSVRRGPRPRARYRW